MGTATGSREDPEGRPEDNDLQGDAERPLSSGALLADVVDLVADTEDEEHTPQHQQELARGGGRPAVGGARRKRRRQAVAEAGGAWRIDAGNRGLAVGGTPGGAALSPSACLAADTLQQLHTAAPEMRAAQDEDTWGAWGDALLDPGQWMMEELTHDLDFQVRPRERSPQLAGASVAAREVGREAGHEGGRALEARVRQLEARVQQQEAAAQEQAAEMAQLKEVVQRLLAAHARL